MNLRTGETGRHRQGGKLEFRGQRGGSSLHPLAIPVRWVTVSANPGSPAPIFGLRPKLMFVQVLRRGLSQATTAGATRPSQQPQNPHIHVWVSNPRVFWGLVSCCSVVTAKYPR